MYREALAVYQSDLIRVLHQVQAVLHVPAERS